MSVEPIVAAGCLVTRTTDAGVEVLLVHRPKYNDWSLPKGKQDEGEHVLETAVREVREESGVEVALRQPLGSRAYTVAGEPKIVYFWRAQVVADHGFTPGSEVDEIAWLSVPAARKLATLELDAELIDRAVEPAATPFVILRHGHAAKRSAWSGEDVDRPLDPAGVAQSDELVPRLATFGITRVHTSAARRCVQSVCPYADARGLPVVNEPGLTEYTFRDAPNPAKERVAGLLADAVRNREPTLLCGHRPYLPELVDYLLEGTDLVGPHDTVPVGSMIVLYGIERPGEALTITALEHHLL
ncbi:MAG TPA: NUDIX domain-containing protein [Actinomycetes bacterium]|nr:NUDIX domain-containing protein [Actinomycetes bacterium]